MKAEILPEVKEIVGAMIFAAERPLKVADIKRCFDDAAALAEGEAKVFAALTVKDIREALDSLSRDAAHARCGLRLAEIAGGYRFQTDPACALWVKQLLKVGKPSRLTQPGLETLAIIAYRQPITKAEIESIRGVGVDHVLKQLMELQLVKLTGRSELPGRPFLYGSTKVFLEHFGLSSIDELRGMDPALAALKVLGERKGTADKGDNGNQPETAELPLPPGGTEAAAPILAEEEGAADA